MTLPQRYEVLPFGPGEDEAVRATEPLSITVTCSPRQGIDASLEVALRLRSAGHRVALHAAARMFGGHAHLDAVLAQMRSGGIDDLFLVGGDASEASGPWDSAAALLPIVDDHPRRPGSIGIAGYPEGHPSIDQAVLDDVLLTKSAVADYVVSQMCFDPQALGTWTRRIRREGVEVPLWIGLPGLVERKRLLEVSLRIGVGASVSFLRKQRGLRHLLERPRHVAQRLESAARELAAEPDAGVAGLHFFTFNRLEATHAWQQHPERRRVPARQQAVGRA